MYEYWKGGNWAFTWSGKSCIFRYLNNVAEKRKNGQTARYKCILVNSEVCNFYFESFDFIVDMWLGRAKL